MDGQKRLQEDLKTLKRFVEEIPDYLKADTLFWPMGPILPQLTFGGVLLRQHRLLMLRDHLNSAESNTLDQTITQFQIVLEGQIIRFEDKAHQEINARLRQWEEYLRDLQTDPSWFNYYKTSIEPRVMLTLLLEHLSLPPYQLKATLPKRVEQIDMGLQARWLKGEFVWPELWQTAYPKEIYWYLYGEPI